MRPIYSVLIPPMSALAALQRPLYISNIFFVCPRQIACSTLPVLSLVQAVFHCSKVICYSAGLMVARYLPSFYSLDVFDLILASSFSLPLVDSLPTQYEPPVHFLSSSSPITPISASCFMMMLGWKVIGFSFFDFQNFEVYLCRSPRRELVIGFPVCNKPPVFRRNSRLRLSIYRNDYEGRIELEQPLKYYQQSSAKGKIALPIRITDC